MDRRKEVNLSMNEKPFCQDCEHYLSSPIESSPGRCYAPANIILREEWKHRYDEPIHTPDKINAKNDCQMYQPIKGLFRRTLEYKAIEKSKELEARMLEGKWKRFKKWIGGK